MVILQELLEKHAKTIFLSHGSSVLSLGGISLLDGSIFLLAGRFFIWKGKFRLPWKTFSHCLVISSLLGLY